MSEYSATDDRPEAWFAAFREQSAAPDRLGVFAWAEELSGGLSDARVYLVLATPTVSDVTRGPLVLKWGPIDDIQLVEAAHLVLARDVAAVRRGAVTGLRGRGADHIARRASPADPEQEFGIVAAPYAGSLDPYDHKRIKNFQRLVQDDYLRDCDIAASDLERLFKRLADALTAEQETKPNGQTLRDVFSSPRHPGGGFASKLRDARAVLSGSPGSGDLGGLEAWLTPRLKFATLFPDARNTHGDPRFANVIADRNSNSVSLIDWGEGSSQGHAFSDLARFEVDILLRTTPPRDAGQHRFGELCARLRILQSQDAVPAALAPELKVSEMWRHARNKAVKALLDPDDLNQYAIFVIYELLKRITWWAKPGRTVSDVGGTPNELVAAINWVREAVEEREGRPVRRDWTHASLSDLAAVLGSWCINTSSWGAGAAKTLEHLLAELRSGDSEVLICESGLVRRVCNIWVDVHVDDGDVRRHLVELRQDFADGRTRVRTLPASIGEKAKSGEEPSKAAKRGLKEELGLTSSSYALRAGAPRENPDTAQSYPGLRSEYLTFWFEADLKPAAYEAQGYVEKQRDKQTHFGWEPLHDSQTTPVRPAAGLVVGEAARTKRRAPAHSAATSASREAPNERRPVSWPGRVNVRLLERGDNHGAFIAALTILTGVKEGDARNMSDVVGGIILSDIEHDEAVAACGALKAVGAVAVVEGNTIAPDPLQVGSEDRLGDVLLDSSILDYEGVRLEDVIVIDAGLLVDWPGQPAIVEAAKSRVEVPQPNRPKAHLIGWQPPVIDQGNRLRIELAQSDYLTSVATSFTIGPLQRLVEDGRVSLDDLPRRLDVHLIVIAGRDDHVLLSRRGRYVATEPSTWMVSVGESIDWSQDAVAGLPHPLLTARRCLTDFDELNLSERAVAGASFQVVGLATEWNQMLANLIVVAELPDLTVSEARSSFRKGENLAIDSVPFTIDACAPIIDSGRFAGAVAAHRVSDISRLALRAALRHRFGHAA